ncbi:MAG TPA: acetylglucosamine transferase [Burkholderiaceae bacterium]|jgi:predicted O-linked N-acetylglucosamine transferase (SPINDLY family)
MVTSDINITGPILQAWQRKMDMAELFDHASQLETGRQHELAAALYQTWLARNNTAVNQFVYFNLGTALFHAGDLEGAKAAQLQAIALMPSFVQPHFNLGVIHERQGHNDAALAEWRWVLENASAEQPDQRAFRLLALNNLGRLSEATSNYAAALAFLTQSLQMEPNQPDVLHHWVFLRAKQCIWPVYEPLAGIDVETMRRATSALALLSLSDDPDLQRAAARHYVEKKLDASVVPMPKAPVYKHEKLRIAYLSSDFCLHPVAMLTAELFELHDRSSVEVHGYCWSREDGSAIRQRIIGSMDRFERIGHLSDEAAAQLIRSHEIDVLVDLHGQTLGARPNLLAHRPAPIQVTYLGLPATTGLPSIDYVIADRFLIPEDCAASYSEKPLYMPDIYQVSDRRRACGPIPSRASCGLPVEAFVFCSFNNNYKFTPEVFAVWMSLLKRVPGSVLWLLADNPWAEQNLRKQAAGHGVDVSRLIFAPRVSPENYLARYAVADLFLDSFPFNAGTTANDALWMGLPVLTYSGRAFAARMAGALLTAAGLPELITDNLRDYEEKAVALATAPERCRALREALAQVKQDGVLFDTPRFVRHLEQQLLALESALA